MGRGYDCTIGSLSLRAKGDIVSGALGNSDMQIAVNKYSPESKIIDSDNLRQIGSDLQF